jgi:hypothetical protein
LSARTPRWRSSNPSIVTCACSVRAHCSMRL